MPALDAPEYLPITALSVWWRSWEFHATDTRRYYEIEKPPLFSYDYTIKRNRKTIRVNEDSSRSALKNTVIIKLAADYYITSATKQIYTRNHSCRTVQKTLQRKGSKMCAITDSDIRRHIMFLKPEEDLRRRHEALCCHHRPPLSVRQGFLSTVRIQTRFPNIVVSLRWLV